LNWMPSDEFVFKVAVIGDHNVGKTTLVKRFVDDTFQPNVAPTLGVDFYSRVLEGVEEGVNVRLQFWDTAGAEKYNSLVSTVFRGASAVIVCFDITNASTFAHVEGWVRDAKQHCQPQAYFMLVATKADLEEVRAVPKEDAVIVAKRNGMFLIETSSLDGTNTFTALEHLGLQLLLNVLDNPSLINSSKGRRQQQQQPPTAHSAASAEENRSSSSSSEEAAAPAQKSVVLGAENSKKSKEDAEAKPKKSKCPC
jgi:small GTP-binding protein